MQTKVALDGRIYRTTLSASFSYHPAVVVAPAAGGGAGALGVQPRGVGNAAMHGLGSNWTAPGLTLLGDGYIYLYMCICV